MVRFDRFRIGNQLLNIFDHAASLSSSAIAMELIQNCYGADGLTFPPGSIIVDIGGHVGMFSILMGLRHPHARILTYEAYTPNYELLVKNIESNPVDNVFPFNLAVTGHGKPVTLTGMNRNSGGASMYTTTGDREKVAVPSITLNAIFDAHQIKRCDFLKLDCEGAEYDLLNRFTNWDKVKLLGGEFHINGCLSGLGCSPHSLLTYCATKCPVAAVKFCQMDQ